VIANDTEYQKAQDEIRILEDRLRKLHDSNQGLYESWRSQNDCTPA
jgi:hypothetical protein